MKRRHAAQYRHTATLSAGDHDGAWNGDVTLIYSVYWGCRATFAHPAEGACVRDWSVVAVDRVSVGPGGAPREVLDLVESQMAEELEQDLLTAAQEADDYAEEAYWDERREELLTTGVLW